MPRSWKSQIADEVRATSMMNPKWPADAMEHVASLQSEITRLRQLLSEAETREREAREFNSAWAEAAAKALDGDMRELRIRVQLSGSEWEATSSELRQTDLVTISELTERFGISPMTLHRWRRDQRVNFPKEIRVGRLVRFSARQIEQWLNDQAASGRAALERSEG